jgi:hypothetical protein
VRSDDPACRRIAVPGNEALKGVGLDLLRDSDSHASSLENSFANQRNPETVKSTVSSNAAARPWFGAFSQQPTKQPSACDGSTECPGFQRRHFFGALLSAYRSYWRGTKHWTRAFEKATGNSTFKGRSSTDREAVN